MNLEFFEQYAQRTALICEHRKMSYQELSAAVEALANYLIKAEIQRLTLQMDNSIDWILWDLACQKMQCVMVPIPAFFSESQKQHLLLISGAQAFISMESVTSDLPFPWTRSTSPDIGYQVWTNKSVSNPILPEGTGKITFTSGSTGKPKGVCLSNEHLWKVALSLQQKIQLKHPRHLSLLPYSTLLENIAGILAPLLAGGTIVVASESQRGFIGSRLEFPEKLLSLISNTQPDSLILVPELLRFLVIASTKGWKAPSSLKFIAVGGSTVSAELLKQAEHLSLPVFQGYGLSECGSVVSINTHRQNLNGSVGTPLPHINTRIENGELIVSGSVFLGYINEPDSFYPREVRTGDLVSYSESFLKVAGRLKNQIINSYGRNISPEWIESLFMDVLFINHIMVYGDGLPWCGAIIDADKSVSDDEPRLVRPNYLTVFKITLMYFNLFNVKNA